MGYVVLTNVASHHWFKQFEEPAKFWLWMRSNLCAARDRLEQKTSFGFCRSGWFALIGDFLIDHVLSDFKLGRGGLTREFEQTSVDCANANRCRSYPLHLLKICFPFGMVFKVRYKCEHVLDGPIYDGADL